MRVLNIGALSMSPRHRHRLTLSAPRCNTQIEFVIYTTNKEATLDCRDNYTSAYKHTYT